MTQGKENSRDFIYRVVRINTSLRPYISLLGVGLDLLLYSWRVPKIERGGGRNTRVRMAPDDLEKLNYLVQHTKKSAAEIVSAALVLARDSNVRPPRREDAA